MSTRPKTPDYPGSLQAVEPDFSEFFDPHPPLFPEPLEPILPPPQRLESLRRGLLERAAQSAAAHAGLITVRARDGAWQPLKPGIRYKPLWSGKAGNSVLIELAAGTFLPVHRHRWAEEGIVLRGDLYMGNLALGRFDYHVSPAGSRHQRIGSRGGALAYLRGTSLGNPASALGEVLGGLLPYAGQPAKTVFADEDGWEEIGPGVQRKRICSDEVMASYFFRLEAGARVAEHEHPQDEECIMLDGEIFLGDILLRAGEYQVAPAGTRHGLASTDVGALLYVRGAKRD